MKPSSFDENRGWLTLSFGEENKVLMPGVEGKDANGYCPVDVPQNASISTGHSHIYVDGALQRGAKILMRQGVVSASSLGENSEVIGGLLVILSSESLSRLSKNLRLDNNGYAPILVVPEETRAQVFDFMVTQMQHNPRRLIIALRAFQSAFPKLPSRIIANTMDDQRSFEDAGLIGNSPD